MRTALATAVALVAGLVLGGLLPRAEVRRLEAQVEALRDRADRPLLARELVRAMQPAPAPAPAPEPTAPDAGPAPPDAPPPTDVPATPPDPDGPGEDLAEGRAILAARRAQARAALLEDAAPTSDQLARFDDAVADMNAELRALGEDLLARVRAHGGPPPRTELYLYAADGLDLVLETEARIHEALGARADAADPEAIDPLSHVDPALVDLLVELDRAGFDP